MTAAEKKNQPILKSEDVAAAAAAAATKMAYHPDVIPNVRAYM